MKDKSKKKKKKKKGIRAVRAHDWPHSVIVV